MPALRKFIALAAAVAVGSSVFTGAAWAKSLTLTETYEPDEWRDPKNAIGNILVDEWAEEAKQEFGSYGFAYGLITISGKVFLVSSLRGASCVPNSCTWRIDRLSSDYRVEASGKPFEACGEINKVDTKGDELTICGKKVVLP